MSTPTARRLWSDAQLTEAVKVSSSWRGVMRQLGLNATSAGAIRVVRRHAARLGLDSSHFRGKRRWSEAQLKRAVTHSQSWDEVLDALGLSANSGNIRPHLKGHAIRLGLDLSHLSSGVRAEPESCTIVPVLEHLREAGPAIAAAWFMLGGCSALFPVEPTTYDLVASMPDGLRRVQVKTTTSTGKNGWQVSVGRRPYSIRKDTPLVPYDPDVIDYFFIIDGDMNMYLIPSRVIAGRVSILLRTYQAYIVGNASGLLGTAADAGARNANTAVQTSA
jgi:hypothetical protein